MFYQATVLLAYLEEAPFFNIYKFIYFYHKYICFCFNYIFTIIPKFLLLKTT